MPPQCSWQHVETLDRCGMMRGPSPAADCGLPDEWASPEEWAPTDGLGSAAVSWWTAAARLGQQTHSNLASFHSPPQLSWQQLFNDSSLFNDCCKASGRASDVP
mmetsp:Transcript_73553/g.153545  ORF Transcript_73553/g.153545 Transcript_73553/m.153545 type:complete len:104 (-) Transcript_73553:269-580(-)